MLLLFFEIGWEVGHDGKGFVAIGDKWDGEVHSKAGLLLIVVGSGDVPVVVKMFNSHIVATSGLELIYMEGDETILVFKVAGHKLAPNRNDELNLLPDTARAPLTAAVSPPWNQNHLPWMSPIGVLGEAP